MEVDICHKMYIYLIILVIFLLELENEDVPENL